MCVRACVRTYVRACGFTRCTRLSLCGPPQNGDMAVREYTEKSRESPILHWALKG
jgi:hypothetical protein